MRRTALLTAAALIGSLTSSPPASADYAPFTQVSPSSGPAGTAITITPDASGRCGNVVFGPEGATVTSAGTVTVMLGRLDVLPDIGGVVELDEVLVSTTLDADEVTGLWSTVVTVPPETEPGTIYATARCDVAEAAPLGPSRQATILFDYFPAAFEVTGETSTTVTSPTTTEQAVLPADAAPTAPPATPLAADPTYTG